MKAEDYTKFLDKAAFDAALLPGIRDELKETHYDALRAAEALTFAPFIDASGELYPEVAEQRDCVFCGAPAAQSDELLRTYGLHYVTCRQCGGTYTRQIVRDDIDRARYEGSPAVEQHNRIRELPAYDRLVTSKALYVTARTTAIADGRTGRLLEIGCADGTLLRAARQLGWEASGIDPFEPFVLHCRSQGFRTALGYFPDDLPTDWPRFDAIALLDVLEHAADPRTFLRNAWARLVPGGLIAIQVPNLNSLFIRLQGATNINFTHGHWTFFTPHSLAMMMVSVGFEPVFHETIITELDGIHRYPPEQVRAAFRLVTGRDIGDPAALDAQTLHGCELGYKVFAVCRRP
jgi:2-polyprenyl-3-methyl-5-hydroxy-6-metoxy-1,4-benzoquinol methylase